MFVYTWDVTRDGYANYSSLRLFLDRQGKPLVRKIIPGVSSFHERPSEVRDYFFHLLDIATAEIAREYHTETPLYILATAGMRLLPEQDIILNEVRAAVRSKYQFRFKDAYVETITGDEEALFGWIAINFILGSFSSSSKSNSPTHGMLDLGGASVQISFEVSPDQPVPKESSMKFEFFLSDSQETLKYRVYAASYLNYGMQEFRNLNQGESNKTANIRNVNVNLLYVFLFSSYSVCITAITSLLIEVKSHA
ncbi:unnamed protein product [Echinostoma caproni]|uniref:Ectonucleoside triphosphate diphosphohydrolase 5 n=1 Tax=Echinostoma caproni TaxID=27848 RepID=A0A183AEV8_9TREM|nr:unnamed protein product [Echinostoma caproni]